jgi:hypothetical protein
MKPRPRPNQAMRDAVKRAVAADTPAAKSIAYGLAERQRDERAAPRTSPGFDRYWKAKQKSR